MNKIGARRRALSTIVTAGIMLSAVAILGSSVIAWSNGNLKTFETALTKTAVNSTNKINENISIENIAFCNNCVSPTTVINVTLTNTGTVGVKVTKIQINSTSDSYVMGTSLPVNILPQKSYLVAVQLPQSPSSVQWHSKSVETITVTTSRGSIFTTQAAAP